MATISNLIPYNITFKPTSNLLQTRCQVADSSNRILYTRIRFEGWFEGRFEGGLRLSLKCLQTNLNFGMGQVTTLRGLKVGLISLNEPLMA